MIIGLGIMIIVCALIGGTAAALGNWWIFWCGFAGVYGPGTLWAIVKVRELRGGAPAAQPAASHDLAFLANCLWCADLSEEPLDCCCGEGCPEVEWCVARYERTNTAIGAIPPYREPS
jgi:hypothetical protein